MKPAKLHVVKDDEGGAMPQAARAAHEPSRNLRCVSAVPAGIPNAAGPSESFIRRSRNPDLAEEALRERRRFEPTTKQDGDVVI